MSYSSERHVAPRSARPSGRNRKTGVAAFTTEKLRASGASAAEVSAHVEKMEQFRRLYANPLFNVLITFMEVFPVGLIVTLVSAGILRRRPPAVSSAATVMA